MRNLDADWERWRVEWSIPDGVTYLNHGSFGPSPKVVQQARQQCSDRLESQPMDFFVRQMEKALDDACRQLGQFLGADGNDLIFVDNATTGMNIVADNVDLQPDDEVLVGDHEYSAVLRLWRRACNRRRARLVTSKIPCPIADGQELVDGLFGAVTERTRLIVVSHVTSPTAIVFPVERICHMARKLGIPVCIDGPHAVAMRPLDLERIDCDYYTASCHKWLSAPFGSGFLYAKRKRQQGLQPPVISWGGSVSGKSPCWKDEFTWIGTRDPASYLSVPTAIEFLESCGLETFRQRTHELAQYARQKLLDLTGLEPIVPDSRDFYGSMVSVPLPSPAASEQDTGHRDPLQDKLWDQFKIEVPIIQWQGRRFVRVSCHLYNRRSDIDYLVDALRNLLYSGTAGLSKTRRSPQ